MAPRFAARGARALLVVLAVCLLPPSGPATAGTSSRASVAPGPGTLLAVYAQAHRAGLLISVPRTLSFDPARPPAVRGQSPVTYRIVARGSVVTLFGSRGPVDGSEPSAFPGSRPAPGRAPAFRGSTAAQVAVWARTHGVTLSVTLGPLQDGGARTLLANYRVLGQTPAAGRSLHRQLTIVARQQPDTVRRPVSRGVPACAVPGRYQLLADDGTARVMSLTQGGSDDETTRISGCDRTTGRLLMLEQADSFEGNADDVGPPMLAGHFAGFDTSAGDHYGDCSSGFDVFDARTGRRVRATSDPCVLSLSIPTGVISLSAINPLGFAAYVETVNPYGSDAGPATTVKLWVSDHDGARVVDSAEPHPYAFPPPFSRIAFAGSTLTWTSSGLARSAPVG